MGDLSGGERRRLQLTRVLMGEPNVLLLDEPTNDLDIDTLQELEDLLDGWPGTLVVISHDRYLIERIADSTYALFGDGRLTHLPGGIEQYLTRRAAEQEHPRVLNLDTQAEAEQRGAGQTGGAGTHKALSSQQERALRKQMNALERRIEKADARAEEIEARIAQLSAQPTPDFAAIGELSSELSEIRAVRDEDELEWLDVGEQLEQ